MLQHNRTFETDQNKPTKCENGSDTYIFPLYLPYVKSSRHRFIYKMCTNASKPYVKT